MKSRSPRHATRLSMIPAALLCAAAVHAAPKTLEMPREKQLESTWCWAAVSAMAVNSFPITLPDGRPVTQRTTVILKQARIKNETEFTNDAFNEAARGCTSVGSCGGSNEPFLYNARATAVPAGKVLSKKVFDFEIGVRKRPVIINWDYGPGAGAAPRGRHLLIITGYKNGKLRLFDPWPVDNGQGDNPRHKRERWIEYQTYLDPVMDMGQPVTAMHSLDLYQLRRFDQEQPAELAAYPKLRTFAREVAAPRPGLYAARSRTWRAETFTASDGAPVASAEPHRAAVQGMRDLGLWRVDFAEALAATRPKIEAHVARLSVTLPDGATIRGRKRLQAGRAFPLITLDTAQILTNRDKQQALFDRKTAVLLVPVIDTRTQEVIDSFLIYNQEGSWKIGGYANTEIAEVLVQQRRSFAGDQRRVEDFFVVSVPERSAFYFAHGAPGSVQLISVDNQGRDPEGRNAEFKAASATLDGLAQSIDEHAAKNPK